MKTFKLAVLAALVILFAGCASQPPAAATPTATPSPTAFVPTATPGPAPTYTDERLLPDKWNAPEKLDAPFNKGLAWVDQPWISPDGRKLYFVYYDCGRPEAKLPGSQGFFDAFVSQKQADGKWGAATALPASINSQINEAAAVESFDGTQLFFTSQNLEEAMKKRLKRELFVSHATPYDAWTTPKSLGPKINAAGMQADTPSLTADGKTIYFMRNEITGEGTEGDTGMHIYYSTRESASCDDCWSEPTIMPAPVTGEREIQPMIRPDGNTLYFSKEKDGKLFLAVTHKKQDGGWTEPKLLADLHDGSAIGEGAASLTADGKTIFFGRAYPTGNAGDLCGAARFELYFATRKTA